MCSVLAIAKKIIGLKGRVTETGYYPDLRDLIECIASEGEDLGIYVYVSPSKTKGGFPDIQIVRKKDDVHLGFIEVKLPGADLSDDGRYKEQFFKYKESSENLIITDIYEWQLWQRYGDEKVSSQKKCEKWKYDSSPDKYGGIREILEKFVEKEPIRAKEPQQLADLLARRCKRLAESVQAVYDSVGCPANLKELFQTIKQFLIKDIDVPEYVNMFAETITYSLFIARLQHYKNGEKDEFDMDNALTYLRHRLPKIPLLEELYYRVNTSVLARIKDEINVIVQDLKLSDIKKINQIFTKQDPDNDPIVYFYEPFLKYIDPEKKKKRGVFYTPKPIADFIVRSIDLILKDDFLLEEGLANKTVHLLDPAVGTATFPLVAIEEIYENLKKKWSRHEPEYIKKKMYKIIHDHILKRFYGFEVMMAPYAIAHLKLSLFLGEIGYTFTDEEQFKIFLTNTLEEAVHHPSPLYDQIGRESKAARKVKNDKPVIVITGNPPYSNYGQMNMNDWIEDLLKDYKKDLGEQKTNLNDDFIKFIRFAQWKLDRVGQGVFAMITNNTFIDGITHRQMRKSLLESFDEIYIYNLHGNKIKEEVCPDGSQDDNVFDIKDVGVSINIFVKHSKKKKKTIVKYCDLWGLKKIKLDKLRGANYQDIRWEDVKYEEFNEEFKRTKWGKNLGELNFFIPSSSINLIYEYGNYCGLSDIFQNFNSGIITRNDPVTIHTNRDSISSMINDFNVMKMPDLREKYEIEDGKSWKLKDAIRDVKDKRKEAYISPILYRPFDIRFTYFTDRSGGFLNRPIYDTMKHFANDNLGIVFARQQPKPGFHHIYCTKNIADIHLISDQNYIAPLYLYDEIEGKKPNFQDKAIKQFKETLGLKFIDEGQGDLMTTFGPEDVFYYIYGILHSNQYRKKYQELLRIDFPRIPITTNKLIFMKLVKEGKNLVKLHLLNSNPFDVDSKSIFDRPSQWGVSIGSDDKKLDVLMITKRDYVESKKRLYFNKKTFFKGIEKAVWEFIVGSYQVLDKWLKGEMHTILDEVKIDGFLKIVVSLKETIKAMQKIDPYVGNIIQENMYINFKKECQQKDIHVQNTFWQSKSKEQRREIVQGFAVYRGGTPHLPKEDVEFIKRLMLLTKEPLSLLQNKQPA